MIYYLVIINIISFLMMGIDKLKSIKNKYRISENSLLFVSLIGGSIGIICGMYIFRHKTLKYKFTILIPLILIIQVLVFLWYN